MRQSPPPAPPGRTAGDPPARTSAVALPVGPAAKLLTVYPVRTSGSFRSIQVSAADWSGSSSESCGATHFPGPNQHDLNCFGLVKNMSREVAIIGTSCRVAGANSPAELWESMVAGEDLQSDTSSRFTGYYDKINGKTKGLTNVHHAYLMKDGIDRFDNSFFGIAPVEAAAIDPQQRLLLEICWEAFESAGIPLDRLRGSDTAVFAGLFTSDYGTSLLRDIDTTPKYHSTGTSNSIAANRISYFFNLRGPSMVIDTACSSTVTALHQAITTLKTGGAEQAVVCGANLILNPDMFVTMSELGFLSPRGRCHSFDASGDGYARGEGVMAIVLKPLEKAIADNDPIRAVIRGSRLNQDGRTNGITLPSGEAQEENIRKLYSSMGILPGDLDYLEAHGTGTKVGDPIEMGAIERVFANEQRRQKLIAGSVKCHVGHLEACAALIGIIKTIECLERGFIPAQLHLLEKNPKINFDELQIPTSTIPWPEKNGRPRVAGINSFGFGGANGHVVLSQFLRTHACTYEPDTTSGARPFLVKVSADSESALARSRDNLASYLSASASTPISDVSYTSLLRRSLLRKSQFFVASSTADLVQKLRGEGDDKLPAVLSSQGDERTKRLALVLTGQGAQWAQMGKDLLDVCPIFTSVINECDAILSSLPDPPSWTLYDELRLPAAKSNVNSSRYSQPLCTALQLGLINFWRRLGIRAVACVGHSSGEISGAYAAGILTLKDAITVAYYRGVWMSAASASKPGAMAALSMSAEECTRMLSAFDGKVDLAAVNSPSSCTISGDAPCIDEIVKRFTEEGVFCRKLRVDTAFHSHHMVPLAEPYRNALEKAGVSPVLGAKPEGSPTMYSSVYGRAVDAAEVTPDYWAKNMTQTVRFCDAISALAKLEHADAYLEVGPHPALKGPAVDSITNAVGQESKPEYFGTLSRGVNSNSALLSSVGAMLSARIPLKLERDGATALGLSHVINRVLVDYPFYSWDHSAVHWAESRVSKSHRFRKHRRDIILGSRVPHDTPLSMCWRNILRTDELQWLNERAPTGESSLSPSFLLQLAIRAGLQVASDHSYDTPPTIQLTGIRFHESLDQSAILSSQEVETQYLLIPQTRRDQFTFRLLIHDTISSASGTWITAFEGHMSISLDGLAPLGPESATVKTDEAVVARMESHLPPLPEPVSLSSVDGASVAGEVTSQMSFESIEMSDLELFDWIFGLLYRHMGISGDASKYTLTTVEKLTIDLKAVEASPVQFAMRIQNCAEGRGQATLTMAHASSGIHSLVVEGATSIVKEKERARPPTSSLFFQPAWLPDITAMEASDTRSSSLARVIELATHKWPACDIGIATKREELQALILSLLPGARSSERPRFRSVTTMLEPKGPACERASHDGLFSPKDLTLLFTDDAGLDEKIKQVTPGGFLCVLLSRTCPDPTIEGTQGSASDTERLCTVEVDSSTTAVLFRRKAPESLTTSQTHQTLMVSTTSAETTCTLRDVQSLHAAAEQHKSGEAVDLVVFDNDEKSLLCLMPPKDWLSSVQKLVADARKLLWVTKDTCRNDLPHWGAASAFLRTLSSEQPLLSAATLNLRADLTQNALDAVIKPVLDNLRNGSKESEMRFEDGQLKILRYLPDDELNATSGAGPVHRAFSRITCVNHQVGHAQPGQMMVNPIRHLGAAAHVHPAEELVHLDVQLSVMDVVDVQDAFSHKAAACHPGQFFLGKTVDGHQLLRVGYSPGCHTKRLQVPVEQTVEVPPSADPKKILLSLAAHALAYAIMTQTARARTDDVIRVLFRNNSTSAFEHVARFLGCRVVNWNDKRHAVDFELDFAPEAGYTLNGKVIDVKSALRKTRFNESLGKALISMADHNASLPEYGLESLQAALAHASQTGDVIALHHDPDHELGVLQEFRHIGASGIFRKDAFYVLIGGFGGLGLLLMEWMLKNGARNFAVISRSGASSERAQAVMQKIDALGGRIDAIKADAGDAQAMKAAISTLRSAMPIGGCFNMALILDNSPFSTMTPTQWDLGIRHKVDTAVALHEATLQDELDFFIMFSSISSISGNRTQAAYASGNAFQNAMAEHRRALGLPAVSVALGAMEGVGTLAEDADTLRTLKKSGLRLLNAGEFLQIVESAVHESKHQDRYLLVTGFEMFPATQDAAKTEATKGQVFWEGFPELSHLFEHEPRRGDGSDDDVPLAQRLTTVAEETAHNILCTAFLDFLSGLLGYPVSKLDPTQAVAAYGVDSLNAVACRFWIFQQLSLDVPIFDILGSRSIDAMIAKCLDRIRKADQANNLPQLPAPTRHGGCGSGELVARTLSHSQSRLWFLHNFLADKTLYNLLLTCHIDGTVNTAAFRKTWETLVLRHESLRTCIVDSGSGWLQIPAKQSTFTLTEVHCSAADFARQNDKLTSKARRHVFDPSKGALVCGWLLVSPAGSRFYMASHHLAWDRGSVGTIFEELPQIYKNLIDGKQPAESLEDDPMQFIDYTVWQDMMLQTKELVSPHVEYWRTQLQGIPECVSLLRLSRVPERPVVKQQEASSAQAVLNAVGAKRLKDFCATRAVTPFMFTTFVMGSLVNGLTGDDEIMIGIADGDRGHTAFDRMVGFAVNMLPLRMRFSQDRTCAALLEDLRSSCLQAYEHRAVPFDYLLQVLDVPRKTSHNPIFQIVVNYQSQGAFPKPDFGDFRFVDYDHYNARTQTDIALEVEELSDGSMEFHFEFDAAMYGTEVAETFARMYKFQLEQVIQGSDKRLDQWELASPDDLQIISRLLQPALPEGKSIQGMRENLFADLFDRWVATNPDKTALVDAKATVSYRELDRLTRSLAESLLSSGISAQECVGVCCEPSVEMMVAVYGILRARCIVVPVDPDFPVDRIISIAEDTGLSRVLVNEHSKAVKQKLITAGIIDIREVRNLTKPHAPRTDKTVVPLEPTRPGDIFCALFTSGSTGRPKGVYIGHEQLRYQGEQYHDTLGTRTSDRMLLSSALVFDMSLHAIFGTILHGATLVIATREERYSAEKMNELVVRQKITNCIFTPTQLKLMLRASNQTLLATWKVLRSLTLGGEPVPSWVLTSFLSLNLPHAHLFNGYAPTETTIINSLRRCTAQDAAGDFLPLSPPHAPARFYILDGQGRTTAVGVPGELFIGGPIVNNGYIKRPELTDKSFVPNHLDENQNGESGNASLLYRTGDMFCLEPSGNLRALGRIAGNRQVKIRGMRVELDEVESVLYAALAQLGEVSGFKSGLTGVVYYPKDDVHGWLVAYVECDQGEGEMHAEVANFLKARLKASLAVHMVPNDIKFVADLPKTTTGKLDYKTLLSWDVSMAADHRPAAGRAELQGDEERSLARIWNEVLGSDRDLWRDTDFFSAGGSSILLLRVRTSIFAMHGVDVSLADMFAYPDIQGMAALFKPQKEQATPNSWSMVGDSDSDGSGHVSVSQFDSQELAEQPRPQAPAIDWEKEIALPAHCNWTPASKEARGISRSAVALTGATSMIGAHLLAHLLRESTDMKIHCLAVSGSGKEESRSQILSALATWKLDTGLTAQQLGRIVPYNGDLAHPTLGLQQSEVRALDVEVSEIWHLESDVSLLKGYDSLRQTNIGSLRFLIEFAGGEIGNVKELHYLSTWAVPHLQVWNATTRSPDFVSTEPVPMSHMRPGQAQNLGYLKIRWAAEQLLATAAERGVPASIFRSCMCAPAQSLGCPLPRTDVNRRILAGSLHTGLVPDFGSSTGGGMSWIDASFLVRSMRVLAGEARGKMPQPAIHHLTGTQHWTYAELAGLLGRHVRLASPEEWFAAMRADGNPEMLLQADVLEEWWQAGWRPFAIDGSETLRTTKHALQISPPNVDGAFLKQVRRGGEDGSSGHIYVGRKSRKSNKMDDDGA
ncbi:hypothetical protein SODALDRAFT_377509 [Sodiomyces alkalinus F11]|uniref:Uncharacterized protein n=1 Tax=Sodiomyces alkalinus (strain CBS 110278 / VKM F-3762 / F11) TaxID=1314773 RepID=A0A3N2PYK0_SODAK|nr:hypothetical protein SODALDRAFT_377509 [Sodiomyces alkalinus F11]ROT39562.1 hypothetical protein SODALDRAFT_377509 [Sodiomyces alkalinus F11]